MNHHAVFVEARCRPNMSGCAPPTLDRTRVGISFPLPQYKYPMIYADIPDRFSSTPCLSVRHLFLSPISLKTC